MNLMEFKRLLTNSKRYEMDCEGHLTIIDYYSGKEIILDLNNIDEEMLNELQVEDEEF